jgi:penicillin-binding protein 2
MEKRYANRQFVILGIFVLIGIAFIIRLFYVQLLANKYFLSANSNVLRHITQYPARGLIYDRNGKLLVYNEAAYDMMVVPRQVKEMDTVEFCRLLEIDIGSFRERLAKAKRYSWYRPSVFTQQISREQFAVLQEKLFRFPGFFVQPRTLRKYPYPIAAHTLGYVGEVSARTVENNPYYKPGDYIGISGIERSYEEVLRGKKGMKIRVVDVLNRDMGSFQEGKYDTLSVAGTDLWCTLDADLQAYGERLMQNKKGSIVAIEPTTGEILCMVSSPAFDPNLLVGRIRNENYRQLSGDTVNIPLFNRTLMATYPPGSTFKLVNALVAEQEGIVSPRYRIPCYGGFDLGDGHLVGCHLHETPVDMANAIQHSCNTYFCTIFKSLLEKDGFYETEQGYNRWRDHVMTFGFGAPTGLDLKSELPGFIPQTTYYDKYYGKNRWRSLTVISLAIGQGEILVTPLQLANMTATIANRGYYIIPHVIRGVGMNKNTELKYREKHYTTVASRHFEPVIEGMEQVVTLGTAMNARIDSVVVCAKTGTAQNPHGEDHSIFVAFAPRENPRIAISVIVENAGWGTTWAAPIASLMIEHYLKGTTKRTYQENKMLKGDLINP